MRTSGRAQIFGSGQRLKIHVSDQVVSGMMLAIHSVHENILVQGESRARPPVAVTNVYLRTGNGWRMILHHEIARSAGASGSRRVAENPH